MAIGYVQAVDGSNSGTATCTVTLTPTAGNALLILSRWNGPDATAISTLTSSGGETITRVTPVMQCGVTTNYVQWQWSILDSVSASASRVITQVLDDASGDTNMVTAIELSGAAASSILGTPVAYNQTSLASSISQDITTAAGGSAVFCLQAMSGGSPTVTASPSGNGTWSLFDSANTGGFVRVDYNLNVGSAGAKTCAYTFNATPSTRSGLLIVEVKALDGGSSTKPAFYYAQL